MPPENLEDFNEDDGRLDYVDANGVEVIAINTSLMKPQIFVAESDSGTSSPEQDRQILSEEERKDK